MSAATAEGDRPSWLVRERALVPVVWNEIDAVVFDIGGVFLIRHPEPIQNGMARGGFEMPPEAGSNYHDAHYRGVRSLTDEVLKGPLALENNREFWIHFEYAYLSHLGVRSEQLDAAVQVMFAEVFAKEQKPIWRKKLDHNIDAFQRLGASGMPVAIVTNNDGTAAAQMIDFGVCQVGPGPFTNVAAIVDSGIVGIQKPEPAIFYPALEALGTDASRTLYVGDTFNADVVGASRAGMPVVQLDPLRLHADLAHHCEPDVAAIVARLMG